MEHKQDRTEAEALGRLRSAAEQQLGAAQPQSALPAGRSLADAFQEQEHELRVHQIELTLQMEELQRTNLELQALRDQYRDLYDHAPVGYLTLLEGGVIENVNRAGARQLGQERERLLGRRFSTFLAESSRSSFAAFLRRAFQEAQPTRVELQVLQPQGETLYVQVDALASTQAGPGSPFIRVALTDITPLKLAQDTIMELNATLEQRVEARTVQVNDLNEELETFVQTVTRDLQAPLWRVNGYAELLRDPALPPEKHHQHMQSMLACIDSMNELLGALATYFRVGRQRARFIPVSLERVLADVKRELNPVLAAQPTEWRQAPLPTITGDSRSLKLILSELLSNALKFSRNQQLRQIEIVTRETTTEYQIGIRDNGVGFNMRQKDRLFGVFQRLHSQREFEGLGTGLATVRRAVLRHGGRVWAESKEGQGACFWVAFPRTFSSLF